MSKRKSHDEFVTEISIINPNIEIIGSYQGRKKKVLCKCRIDGTEWNPVVDSLYRGQGCPKCAGNKKKSTIEFIKEISMINKDISILGEYINNSTKIKVECKVCGHIWNPIPSNLTSHNYSCPKCAKENSKLTHKEFLDRLNQVNNEIKPLEVYKGIDTKIKLKCLKSGCNNIWYATPYHILNHRGCPNCHISNGEDEIRLYLKHDDINFIQQYKFDNLIGVGGGLLSYDFYLPDFNLLIEYQGIQHIKPIKFFGGEKQFIIQQEHDKRKRDYALDSNIKLLEIWYWDFDNIEEILHKELNL